jgi:hypothetical protein
MINYQNSIILLLVLTQLILEPGPLNAQSSPVIINEYLASNVRSNAEMLDFGDFNDWLELYNPTDSAFVLNGCYISDDPESVVKWRIPDGTIIQSNDYLLFWADGFDSAPGYEDTRPYWPWDSFTTSNFHTNFKLSASGEFLGLYQFDESNQQSLINQGASWYYLDDGTNQGVIWRDPEFDHSTWSSGPAQLGYGDGDENTIVGYGPDSNDKYITTYFRHEFDIALLEGQTELLMRLLYDDGAVVYLNGTEIMRINLPDTPINYTTQALTYIGGDDEDAFTDFNLPSQDLINGINTLAVEIHQYNGNSSDISFDLELFLNSYNAYSILDTISFGNQKTDVSRGRFPDGSEDWFYFGDPTPASANSIHGKITTQQMEMAQVSPEPGVFANPLTISAMSIEQDANIQYTIDGKRPNFTESEFGEDIIVENSAPFRTRVYSDEFLPSPSTYHSYLVNEPLTNLPVVSIIADPDWLWHDQFGIYQNELKKREIPISLQLFDPSGNLLVNVNAGIRLAGLNIWRFAQKPLLVKMRNRYGFDQLDYPLFEDIPVSMFTEFVLRNGGDDWHGAFLKDALTPALLGWRINNARQAYRPVSSYINGEYWGIYNLREKFDATYFQQHFGANPDELDHIGMTVLEDWVVVEDVFSGDRLEYDELLYFLDTADLNDAENYTQLQTMMDIDNFIDYMIIQLYVSNTSWRHNREWWKSSSLDNKWRWIIVDLDRGFNMDNISRDLLSGFSNDNFIFNRLEGSSLFTNRFLQRYAAHLHSTFLPERVINIVDSLAGNIEIEIPRHIERWSPDDGIQDMTSWYNSIDDIRDFATQRRDHIYSHLNDHFETDGYVQVTIEISGAGHLNIEGITMPTTTTIVPLFQGIPVNVQGISQPGYIFSGWGDDSGLNEQTLTILSDTTLTLSFEPSEETILPSEISSEYVLDEETGPYLLLDDLIINDIGNLIIQPGTIITIAPGASLIVYGGLQVLGTESMPVYFHSENSGREGEWGAICLDNSVSPINLEYLILTGAGNGPNPFEFPAAVSSINSNLSMDNVSISDVPFPVYAEGGYVGILNSQFEATTAGDYINVRASDQVLIENCQLFGNDQFDTDGIDLDQVSHGDLRNNKFYHFTGMNSDGIDIGEQSSDITIEGNLIYNCRDKGISIGQQSEVMVFRNLIVDCGYGIAVKDSNSVAIVDQNTLFNNDIQVGAYEKIPGHGGGSVQVLNTIFANTMQETFFLDEYSSLTIDYSLSNTEVISGEGNILNDPQFISPSGYNFQLLDSSPANGGGSPESPNDPDGSPADIGAYYEFSGEDYPFSFQSNIVINEIMYNAIADQDGGDWIELYNGSSENVNMQGWEFKDGNPLHSFIFEQEFILESGGYLVLCTDIPAFQNIYTDVEPYATELGFGFTSMGELLRLMDGFGHVVSTVQYSPSEPWPTEANGMGPSLELAHPELEVSYQQSWMASTGIGTPGGLNSQYQNPCMPSGDLNLDNTVDVLDIVLLVDIILNVDEPALDILCIGDLNEDGSLDVLDIVIMVDIIISG